MKATTTASVLDAIDAALASASATRHATVMADVPDLEPIPGPWDITTVYEHSVPDEFLASGSYSRRFVADGITYDRDLDREAGRGVWNAALMFEARSTSCMPEGSYDKAAGHFFAGGGLSARVLGRRAADADLAPDAWAGELRDVDGRMRTSAFRYADEGWVW